MMNSQMFEKLKDKNFQDKCFQVLWILVIYFGCYFNVYILITNKFSITVSENLAEFLRNYATMLVPVIVMLICKDKLSDYKCYKERLGKQIIIGIVIGLAIFLVYVAPLYLTGHGSSADDGRRCYTVLEYLREFLFFIFCVGLFEEFICRGVLYRRIYILFGNEWAAIIISSLLFGSQHIFSNGIGAFLSTTIGGLYFAICRYKIKDCTLLSCIIGHGIYDAMFTVFQSVFL